MNYRHVYHAGNHGDVLKHAVLSILIERLQDKPSPIFILDAHAGIGVYELASPEAVKTEEWREGIGRLIDAEAPALQLYLEQVRRLNPSGPLIRYPGSPAIAAALLRPGDRLVLSELHPDDAQALRHWAFGKTGVAVHRRDAYEAINAFLPPREGRGLIVVDPPYEAGDEFEKLTAAIISGHRRWAAGRWLIWHPIKERAPVWRLEEALLNNGVKNLLSAEFLVRPVDGVSLAGSGVLLVNPPYQIEEWLGQALSQIQAALAPQHGSHALRRLDGS